MEEVYRARCELVGAEGGDGTGHESGEALTLQHLMGERGHKTKKKRKKKRIVSYLVRGTVVRLPSL